MRGINISLHQFKEHICNVSPYSLSLQRISSSLVNHFTLRIHHIVILKETFANPEIVFLYFRLRTFNRFRDHLVLDDFSVFVTHPIHHFCNSIRAK